MGPNERESSPTPALTSHEKKLRELGQTGRREWFRRTAGGCVGLAEDAAEKVKGKAEHTWDKMKHAAHDAKDKVTG